MTVSDSDDKRRAVRIWCSAAMAERAPAVCRDAPDFDRDAFHRAYHEAVVSFFEERLPTR